MTVVGSNNKRIAKNTLLLYFRMLFTMIVSLYTSRVVLKVLGVEDFGVYNVVGGVVAMFSVISGSLSTAISRYITYELGKHNIEQLKKVFSTAIAIQALLALLIIILAEIAGVWFLNTKMNIPGERIYAANWVLQCSIFTFAVNLISLPYNAVIIAHEQMSAFAYISIIEILLKLIIVFVLMYSPWDKLIVYAVLLLLISVVIRIIYGIYCKCHFLECRWSFIIDKFYLKEMGSFASWNFIGASAGILRSQGVGVLLNIFLGPTVNAARAIAEQVNFAIASFSNNFMVAVNPQIIKSYSQNNIHYSYKLVMSSARLSYFLLLLLSLPIMVGTCFILQLWLTVVPDNSICFIRLALILSLVESLSLPLVTLQQATGKIKWYQIVVGGFHLLNFPFAWLFLYLKFAPEVVYVIAIVLAILCLYARLYMLRILINLSIKTFCIEVFIRVSLVTIISVLLSFFVNNIIDSSDIVAMMITFTFTLLFIMIFGLKRSELGIIYYKIKLLKEKLFDYIK